MCRVTRQFHRKARQMVFNLKKNAELRTRIISGELTPQEFVRLDVYGMANAQLTAKRKEWIKKRTFEVIRESPIVAGFVNTDIFTCPNCHGQSTRYRQWRKGAIVDRVRIIVVCLLCPYRWEV